MLEDILGLVLTLIALPVGLGGFCIAGFLLWIVLMGAVDHIRK